MGRIVLWRKCSLPNDSGKKSAHGTIPMLLGVYYSADLTHCIITNVMYLG